MTFGLYPATRGGAGPVPVLWFLSGLTCTHENAMVKAGAQGWAARAGIAVVFPDTSPRGEGVADHADYDLGPGGRVLRQRDLAPWAPHFRMWDYVTEDLPRVLFNGFPLDEERQGITGHSMGGPRRADDGDAVPERFASVSAFAPIAHPVASDWGRKQFGAYLGAGRGGVGGHDATLLMRDVGVSGGGAGGPGGEGPVPASVAPRGFGRGDGGAAAAGGVPDAGRGMIIRTSSWPRSWRSHVRFHAEAMGA
jgi:S-formylglutathione hydrolase